MDIDQLMRLKGMLEGSANIDPMMGGEGLVASYPRIREDVASAIDEADRAELERLFPAELSTAGKPWGAQAGEVKLYLSQMAGWIKGMIDAAVLDRQIQADAEAKAKRVGFVP